MSFGHTFYSKSNKSLTKMSCVILRDPNQCKLNNSLLPEVLERKLKALTQLFQLIFFKDFSF